MKPKQTKWAEYEAAKRALQAKQLPAKEYEIALRRIAAKLGV